MKQKLLSFFLAAIGLVVGVTQSMAAYTVTYSLGNVEAEGEVLPTSQSVEEGNSFSIPKNFTLYKEGYTLTGWTDGANTYSVGTNVTPSSDITLTPVFTQNTVSLADRTESVTIKWDFQRKNGAPTVSGWEGLSGKLWVTQTDVNGETIDVKTDFNTTNGGKFANASWDDWCQLNKGTTFTIPNCKGATVSIEAYNALGTGDSPLTIDGQSDYTSAKTISYTTANTASTIDVVIGSEGSYYRYIQTVLPVIQQSGGTTYTDEEVTVTWAMTSQSEPNANTVAPEGVVSIVSFDTGTSSIVGTGNITNQSGTNVKTGIKVQAASSANDLISWNVKPAAGLTFTPVKVSGYINRAGTDVENGIKIYASKEGEDKLLLGTYTAWRSGNSSSTKAYDASAVYMYEITLTSEQQSALTSADGFKLYSTVGAYNETSPKQGIFGEVTITGTVSGTVADVETFTLAAAANIADGGTVTKYPNADEYDEGTEVTLTATKNFGYNFVNWTDSNGEEVSTEASFKYTVTADETLTANFEQIDTYELSLTVDGTNDYMVEVSPAPTVVDGKWMYETGASVKLTANEYAGFVTFTNWNDDDTNVEKTITMTEDRTFTANYTETDIVAGWDFYKAGGNSRVADFSSTDNASASLTLVNTETSVISGWLDKSTLAGGGYESFKGAAVNWRTGSQNGDVGNYHWQTKVNAEAFQSINVYFQMMYNYNAYQKYLAEYSLDGENWTTFGDITMTAAKTAATFSEALPEECNNQSDVYIRMRADKTSDVVGAASANDGNALAMFFITGTEQFADDGIAPVLLSTIPANNATGASATGKIVFTFDEKIKLQTAGAATLGTETLTPNVSGKTVTYSYNGLKYNTEYTFTLPANTVSDLTDNVYAEPVTITFTTMQLPAVTKKKFDVIVGTEGNEDLQTVLDNYKNYNGSERKYIFIPDGTYKLTGNSSFTTKDDGSGSSWIWNEETGTLTEGTYTASTTYTDNAMTQLRSSNLSIIGQSMDKTILYNIPYIPGISYTSTLEISSGSDNYLQDFTLKNMYAGGRHDKGVAVAFYDRGTHTIAKNIDMWSNQDTYVSAATKCYYETSTLAGTVDFICGGGDVWFQECELVINDRNGNVITAPSTSATELWGFVFYDNTIRLADGATSATDGNWNLGRPWKNSPASTFINTTMLTKPSAAAWTNMGSDMVVRFHEYGSVDANGNAIDLSNRSIAACNAAEGSDDPVLTAAQAEQYTIENVLAGTDGWNPAEYTAQVSVENVSLSGNVLSWDDSDYALCWMVFKDGVYYDNVINNSIELTESGSYTVRAANARGGLGESSESVTYSAPIVLTTTPNMAGYKSFCDATTSYVADENTKVYYAKEVGSDKVVLATIDSREIPAGMPVILKTATVAENPAANAYYQMTLTADANIQPVDLLNLLRVTDGTETFPTEGVYRLGYTSADGIRFYTWNPTEVTEGVVYLPKSTSSGAKLTIVFMGEDEEEVTGVTVVDADDAAAPAETYNALGQRVNAAENGFIIVKGKKYVK